MVDERAVMSAIRLGAKVKFEIINLDRYHVYLNCDYIGVVDRRTAESVRDKLYEFLAKEHLKDLKNTAIVALGKHPESGFTCDGCENALNCRFAYDTYNVYGKCIIEATKYG